MLAIAWSWVIGLVMSGGWPVRRRLRAMCLLSAHRRVMLWGVEWGAAAGAAGEDTGGHWGCSCLLMAVCYVGKMWGFPPHACLGSI